MEEFLSSLDRMQKCYEKHHNMEIYSHHILIELTSAISRRKAVKNSFLFLAPVASLSRQRDQKNFHSEVAADDSRSSAIYGMKKAAVYRLYAHEFVSMQNFMVFLAVYKVEIFFLMRQLQFFKVRLVLRFYERHDGLVKKNFQKFKKGQFINYVMRTQKGQQYRTIPTKI